MGKPVGILIADLLKKAGYAADDASLKEVAGISIELSDDAAGAIEKELMTVDGAKQNVKVKDHFKRETLNGLDTHLERLMESKKLPDDVRTKLKGEASTGKRIELMLEELDALKAKEEGSKTGATKDEYTRKITELENKIQTTIQDYDGKLKSKDNEFNGRLLSKILESAASGKAYANKDIPNKANVITALALFNETLAAKGAKLVLAENDQLALRQLSDESLEYRDEKHNPVKWDSLFDQVLLDNKLVSVGEPAKPGGAHGSNPQPNPGNDAPAPKGLESYYESLAASEAAFAAAR